MKCAVRDGGWITLKMLPEFIIHFWLHHRLCPRDAAEICQLDCILDDKKLVSQASRRIITPLCYFYLGQIIR